jgi:hypothetical protein
MTKKISEALAFKIQLEVSEPEEKSPDEKTKKP